MDPPALHVELEIPDYDEEFSTPKEVALNPFGNGVVHNATDNEAGLSAADYEAGLSAADYEAELDSPDYDLEFNIPAYDVELYWREEGEKEAAGSLYLFETYTVGYVIDEINKKQSRSYRSLVYDGCSQRTYLEPDYPLGYYITKYGIKSVDQVCVMDVYASYC